MTGSEAYIQEVLDGTLITNQWIKAVCQRHLDDLERGEERGLYFDQEEGQRFVAFFERFLHHSKGKWAGDPFILLPWQQFMISSLYGWKRSDGSRRFRTLFCAVGRKNGKSATCSGLGLAMLDFDQEPAAEVYFSATKRDQARICHVEAERMVKASPHLKKRIGIHRNNLHVKATGSKAEPLSSEARSLDGLSPHCAIIDEYHAHKDAEIFHVLKSATGSRSQPLLAIVTTAGWNIDGPCFHFQKTCQDVLQGIKDDDSLLPLIYCLDEEDDWKDESTWIKANPSLGESISMEYLQEQYTQATNYGSTEEANFRTKHLNEWVSSSDVWIRDEDWMKSGAESIDIDPKTLTWYGGLDLAAVSDFCCLVLVAELPDGELLARRWYWLPESAWDKRMDKEQSSIHMDMLDLPYFFLSPGNVTDYQALRRTISGYYVQDGTVKHDTSCIMDQYNVGSISFDRWNSSTLVTQLTGDGVLMAPIGMGYASQSAPLRELERLILEKKLIHEADPVLRWMIRNVMIQRDPAGNIKLDKARSQDKIDGVMALNCAVAEWMTRTAEGSNEIPEDYLIRTL
ncbi:terminase large subunit [Flavobacteriales bacterium]|nr:terminase large subunit [Flavobacteriales bacterium]